MTRPQNHKRKYGYIHNPENEVPKKFDRSKIQTENTYQPVKSVNPPFGRGLFLVLLLPIRALWWLISSAWRGWAKRPQLKNSTKQKIRKNLGKIFLKIIIVGGIFSTILVVWASQGLPDPNKLTDRQVAQSTKIYDRTGNHVLYEIFSEQKRTLISFDKIPKDLIKASVATEDTAFYEHHGVRPLSIARAVFYGIFTKRRISGTSTLTQQLVKNAILTNERTLTRKLKEVILSLRLEQKYTKDQILQIYFNEIPYGSTNYGVESAAQSYFSTSTENLNLEQIATIAGLPKAPSRYLNSREALKNRRDFVLERMFEEGYISRELANETQALEPSLDQRFGNIDAPHFSLYVKEQLVEKFGEQLVDTGGLKVISSLDWDKQQIAELAVKEESEKIFKEADANNAALVALDPKTGQILAMVGSRDFYDEEIDGQFNVVTQAERQPGSSFKPIIYAAAFEKGYTPETILFDVETNFAASGESYEPKNYDLKERGPVTMRQALQGSLNIPAVKTLYLVGEKNGVDFAKRLGYSTLGAGNFGLSLVLGGGEVKLIDHASAFSTFANQGVRHEPVSILKVEDNKGDILYEWKKTKGEKVLDEAVANTISSVLSDDTARAYAFGAGGILTLKDRPVATKTGTTNNYVDAWTIGYTPSLVAGVWVGNTKNTPLKRGFGGSKMAAPIWNRFMREALKNTPAEVFPKPPTQNITKPILKGSQGGGVTLLVDKVTGKLATSSTPQNYIVERTYIPPHSILHYVKKDDPQGEDPTDPAADPQYQIWEDAIQAWIAREKEKNPNWEVAFGDPPTEFDDLHSLELIPELTIVYPTPSSTLHSRQIDTDIRVTAQRGVSSVSYKIDEKFVGVIRSHPFNLNYLATGLSDGLHTLTIIVEDDIGNRLEEKVPFNLVAGEEPTSVTWVGGDQSVSQNTFPKIFFLNHFKLEDIQLIKFYQQRINTTEKTEIGLVTDFSNLFNNQITFSWHNAPDKGEWNLIAEIHLKNGLVRDSGVMRVRVE